VNAASAAWAGDCSATVSNKMTASAPPSLIANMRGKIAPSMRRRLFGRFNGLIGKLVDKSDANG
jgi:hypothetical protein